MISRLLKIPAEKFFLVAGFILGSLFLILTPPFQAPDEVNHFYKAWQISEGQFTGIKKDNRVGGYIPSGAREVVKAFQPLRQSINSKTTAAFIIHQQQIPLKADSISFVDLPNTAVYTPVSYLPGTRDFYTS
ncbi:MAG: DUF2142 domain-containing protein [Bacteroidota bacterium]|nr:DUF2142 domain-containing protein [Bacteroidota bacterium]